MTFIVAEIGVNWDGDFDLAQDMMLHAKNSGCSAVKFQAYNEELVKEHPQASRLMKSAITKSNVEKIDQIAKYVGIEWFCTPMYPDAVDFLNPYVNKFKIRWFDGKELFENKISKILEKILETKKEVMISCDTTPKNLTFYNDLNIKWLYCIPKYPCELNDLDFTGIDDYNGFSNHCTHFLAPLSAVILGAKIIEIHITSDKSKDFFDNNVSFDYTELSKLMELIQLSEKMNK
jgi:sialic acid synthase SpsE